MNPIEKFEGELKEIYDDTINKVAIEFYNKGRKEAFEAVQEIITEDIKIFEKNKKLYGYRICYLSILQEEISEWQEELK
ncbi:MAG: hypothetical protein AABY22_21970 [Nanoarchaeota archaeon]